jgi:hypothetical protein
LKSWRGSESASVAPPDALFGAVGVSLRVVVYRGPEAKAPFCR